ncbi:MAG TPA: TonB family protein [Azonexus sp.]
MAAPTLRLYRPAAVLDRRFAALVLLSLLLHAGLLLLAKAPQQPVAATLPALLATLRPAPVIEPGTPAAVPAAFQPKVRQSLAAAEYRPSPQRQKTAGPTTAAPVAAAPATTPAAADGAAAPLAAAVSSAPSAPPAAPSTAPAPDLLAAYRQRLGDLFARRQDYPRLAAMRGWEGEVRLRLRVARKGSLLAVGLDRSSGFAVLDEHAQALVADLGSLPPLPEGLEESEIQVVIPIKYKLNKTT